MNQPKRSSGRLFPKPPEGNKPNWTGDLTLTPELIQEINQMSSRGEVRLRLAAWNKQSQRPGGGEYLSVSAEMDKKQPGDQPQQSYGGPRQGYQQQAPAGYAPRGSQRPLPERLDRVDRPGFQPPQRPRQLPPEGGRDIDFPFDDSPDFNSPWRK